MEATQIDPNCVDAWFALGKAFHTMNAEKSIEFVLLCAENALRAEPNNPKSQSLGAAAYSKKAELAAEAEEWSEAYDYFKRAYHLEPDRELLADDGVQSTNLLDAWAWAAEHAGKFADLADDLRARLAQHVDDERARYVLGRTLTKMAIDQPPPSESRTKMFSEAEAHLTKFLSTDPLSPEANYFLGFVYVGQGRMDLAGKIVAKLAEIDIERSKDLAEVVTG